MLRSVLRATLGPLFRAVARVVNRADRVLGRVFMRVCGVLLVVPTLTAAQGLSAAVEAGDGVGVAVTGVSTLAFAAAAVFCLRGRTRRLSESD